MTKLQETVSHSLAYQAGYFDGYRGFPQYSKVQEYIDGWNAGRAINPSRRKAALVQSPIT